jgi:hypothetical protein
MRAAGKEAIKWLSEYKKPYIIDGNKLLHGECVFTVLPSIESDIVKSFRLDMPESVGVQDSTSWMLFFVATIGIESFCEVQPQIKAAMSTKGSFDQVVGHWRVQLSHDDHAVLLAEATS